jgi:hypothetical protein
MRRNKTLAIFSLAVGISLSGLSTAHAQYMGDCTTWLNSLRCPAGQQLGTKFDGYTDWGLTSVGGPTAGTWVKTASSDDKVDFCGTCGPASAQLSTTASTTDSDAISTSAEVGLSAEVSASFNVAAVGSMGVKATDSFKAGKTDTSTVSDMVSQSISGTVSAPPPRIAHVKAEIWGLHSRTATASFYRNKLYSWRCCPDPNNCGAWPADVQCYNGDTASGTVTSATSCLSHSRKNASFYDEACANPPQCADGGAGDSGARDAATGG